MDVSCQVNTRGMEAACLALAKITGKSLEEVVDSELTKIIDRTIALIPQAKQKTILDRHGLALFTSQLATLYTPKTIWGREYRAHEARVSNKGYLRYFLMNRYPDPLWSRITARREATLKKALASIGLAKKSFWTIGKMLGLQVKGGRFVGAIPRTGKEYPENFTVKRGTSDVGIAVAFINAQPTVNAPTVKGRQAMQIAIDGRVKFFLKNAELGVFQSLQKVARQYPGLTLKSS
jgi:hypothetical protein